MRSLGVDALNGKMLHADDVFYAADEVVLTRDDVEYTAAMLFADPTDVYWGIQSDGTQRSGKQVSCNWYLVTTEQVVGGTFTDGVVTVDSSDTNDNYYWPPVLDTSRAYGLGAEGRWHGHLPRHPVSSLKATTGRASPRSPGTWSEDGVRYSGCRADESDTRVLLMSLLHDEHLGVSPPRYRGSVRHRNVRSRV
jgi:hypothetical protein